MKSIILFICIALTVSACQNPPAEETVDISSINKQALADSVKQEFLHAWNGYKTHAWGYDALLPLSKTGRNWYDESLLMTPVDAFSTMKLMGLEAEAEEAKTLIFAELDFNKDFYVQTFEVTIRLLGGLISAYQLDGHPEFLRLAKDLGDRLMPGFETATGMPYVRVHLQNGEKREQINNPAEIGTLLLEFGQLSKLTGDPKYYEVAKKAITEVYNRRSDIGLVGTTIDVESGEWENTSSHISGRIDSYYEYFYKGWLLFGDEDLKKMWDESIPAVNQYLWDETENGAWYGYADMYTGERTATNFGALDAFMPGLLALSGDLERAKALQESCFAMWTMHGIEPESLDYSTMEVNSPGYVLRPENIESAFYLYRFTKDEKYLEMGREMFQSLVTHCRTDDAYAALQSVITKEKRDDMESFFLAETLKYAYLLFADESTLSLEEFVFNTEAHPFRIIRQEN